MADFGKGGLAAAWAAGMALYAWREVHVSHRPPVPGALAGITVLFTVLGFASEYSKISGPVVVLAWGLDVAALLNLLPAGLGGDIARAQAAEGPQGAGAPAAAEGGGTGVGEGGGGRLTGG